MRSRRIRLPPRMASLSASLRKDAFKTRSTVTGQMYGMRVDVHDADAAVADGHLTAPHERLRGAVHEIEPPRRTRPPPCPLPSSGNACGSSRSPPARRLSGIPLR